jgi:hypothetical protein
MNERMDKHREKWKAKSERSFGKKTEGDDLVALGVIRTALPIRAKGFRCGRMGGLGTRAYSRPEGDRQINWSWDVCFLRVKWSGANGESCRETVREALVGLAERLCSSTACSQCQL